MSAPQAGHPVLRLSGRVIDWGEGCTGLQRSRGECASFAGVDAVLMNLLNWLHNSTSKTPQQVVGVVINDSAFTSVDSTHRLQRLSKPLAASATNTELQKSSDGDPQSDPDAAPASGDFTLQDPTHISHTFAPETEELRHHYWVRTVHNLSCATTDSHLLVFYQILCRSRRLSHRRD